jgi:phosphoglycerate dehydrogenase-like enzyme
MIGRFQQAAICRHAIHPWNGRRKSGMTPMDRRMKRTAFFINIGRGMTTKLDDLVTALEAGEIAGAALDVYEQEPLPRDHRLWTLPNADATYGRARALPQRSAFSDYVDNCRAFAGGRALRNVVDKSSWF